MKHRNIPYLARLFALSLLPAVSLSAQSIPKDTQRKAAEYLTSLAKRRAHVGGVGIDSVRTDGRRVIFYADVGLSYIPMREPDVDDIYTNLRKMLPKAYRDYSVEVRTDGQAIETLVPAL